MRDLHARLRVEGLTDEEAAQLRVQVTGSTLIRLEISTWRTDAGDLDILAAIPDRDGRHMRYQSWSTAPRGWTSRASWCESLPSTM